MRQVAGYDGVRGSTGAFERIEAGGYVCVIRRAYEEMTKRGNQPMLVIEFDVAEGKYRDYFKDDYERRQRNATGYAQVKWRGTYYQMVLDKDGNANTFFKGMMEAIEQSNPGYKWNWDERSLAGKRIGVIFRDEEYLKSDGSGEVGVSAKAAWVRTADEIRKGIVVPDVKRLSAGAGGNGAYGGYGAGGSGNAGGYAGGGSYAGSSGAHGGHDAPPPTDDELPF